MTAPPRDPDLPGRPGGQPPPTTATRFTLLMADALLDCALDDQPALREHARGAEMALTQHFASGAREPVVMSFGADLLAIDGHRGLQASLHAGSLLRAAADCGLRELRFWKGCNSDELASLARLLDAPDHAAGFRGEPANGLLRQHGITHIEARTRAGDAPQSAQADPTQVDPPRADPVVRGYQGLATAVRDSHVAAARGRELELADTEGAVHGALDWLLEQPSELLGLANYQDVDRFTVGHSVRVALLAMHVARAAGADHRQLALVGTGALLHDVGKSRIPGAILYKQGKLDPDEWRLMQEHPRLGAEILIGQKGIHKSAVSAAFCHHLSPGGEGYPRATLPIRPSSLSSLVHVADVFEALTAIRPYKRELTPIEAFAIMRRHADDFDRDWLAFFVRALGLFPVGSYVALDDGSAGQIVEQGPRPDQPVLRHVSGPHAGRTHPLATRLEGRELRISRALRRSEVAPDTVDSPAGA
jgi:putative nucleotidyltransferase with HDIG domain